MRKRIFIVIILAVFISFLSGITYSLFNSGTSLNSVDQSIAKFVFDAEISDKIELELSDLKPGDTKEYLFSVSNTKEEIVSDVTIGYELLIKTFHFIPVDIKLYKITDQNEELVSVCDETYTRNSNKELVCNVSIEEPMLYSKKSKDDYKLKVTFDKKYNDLDYSNLVDYIDLEIRSWQM